MAHSQTHRGPASMDKRLFADAQLPSLQMAVTDLCWLLDRGYASNSALELVGNRYNLESRQRMAVSRCACPVDSVRKRQHAQLAPEALRGHELWLDGYNVLTVLESALAGGVVLLGRDGCCRDIAGVHGQYRKVNETIPGLQLIGETMVAWGVSCCRWWLDQPVSNSGRLKKLILDQAAAAGWNMSVDLDFNPDRVLSECQLPIATSDGVVLDRCQHWVNLSQIIIRARIPNAWVLKLAEKTA